MKKNNSDKPSQSDDKHETHTPLLDKKISNLKQTVSKGFRAISTRPARSVKDFIQSITDDTENEKAPKVMRTFAGIVKNIFKNSPQSSVSPTKYEDTSKHPIKNTDKKTNTDKKQARDKQNNSTQIIDTQDDERWNNLPFCNPTNHSEPHPSPKPAKHPKKSFDTAPHPTTVEFLNSSNNKHTKDDKRWNDLPYCKSSCQSHNTINNIQNNPSIRTSSVHACVPTQENDIWNDLPPIHGTANTCTYSSIEKAYRTTQELLLSGITSRKDDSIFEIVTISIEENGKLFATFSHGQDCKDENCSKYINLDELKEILSTLSEVNQYNAWTNDSWDLGSIEQKMFLQCAESLHADKVYFENDQVKLEQKDGYLLFYQKGLLEPWILSTDSDEYGRSSLYIQSKDKIRAKIRDFFDIRKTLFLIDHGFTVYLNNHDFDPHYYYPFRKTHFYTSNDAPELSSQVNFTLSHICFYLALTLELGNIWNWEEPDNDTSDDNDPSFRDILIAHDYCIGKNLASALRPTKTPEYLSGKIIDIHDHSGNPHDKGWIWHKDRWVYVKDKSNPPESSNWCWLRDGWKFAWKYVGNWNSNDLRPREGYEYDGGNYIYTQDRYNKPNEYSSWHKGDSYSNAHWE